MTKYRHAITVRSQYINQTNCTSLHPIVCLQNSNLFLNEHRERRLRSDRSESLDSRETRWPLAIVNFQRLTSSQLNRRLTQPVFLDKVLHRFNPVITQRAPGPARRHWLRLTVSKTIRCPSRILVTSAFI